MLNQYFCMSEPNQSGKLSHLPNRTDINWCGIPNCAILKCGCKSHHAQIRTTRENAYHGGEYAPRVNAYHARECTTRENAYHARECTTRENAHHAREYEPLASTHATHKYDQ